MQFLTGRARLAGVIGWPVAFSRSPMMHGFWLRRYGIDGVYVPLAVETDFATAIRGLRAAGFRGANVTKPHKEAAFAICDVVESSASRAGAVNTLVFDAERGIVGSNSDGFGFCAGLAEAGVTVAGRNVLVLGAGGASRAICAALLEAGCRVEVANRTRERAERVASVLPGLIVRDWSAREEGLSAFDLIVNTTSLGMAGNPPLELDFSRAAPGAAVADTVYVPLETPFLAAARRAGLTAVSGISMLLNQARPGFLAWYGLDPQPDAELRDMILASLERGV